MHERIYLATVTVRGSVIGRYGISATNRRMAVRIALQWFWDKYKGKYGPASEVFTVGDPHGEVAFKEPFNCNDKQNNYLDAATAARIIQGSSGVLERDTKTGTPNHPRRSLRRKKRRREYRVTVAPNIQESNTGVFYYRIIVTPQKSKEGRILQKRKMQDVKLGAEKLTDAIEEIRARGLKKLNEQNSARKGVKVRSLKFVSHIAGIEPLSTDDRAFFAPVLKHASHFVQSRQTV